MKSILMAGCCFLLPACVTQTLQVDAVGPASAVAREAQGEGRLVVYSATLQFDNADVTYRPHSSYYIYKTDMTPLRMVVNHSDERDERPELISLPAGSYRIRARAEGVGWVTVPVLVQTVKTTEVHLQGGWKPTAPPNDAAELVRLPNGQIVGWRAPLALDERKAALADAVVKAKLVRAPDVVGVAAYALFETVAIIRNNTDHPLGNRFTVGSKALHKDFSPAVSTLYLKLHQRENGGREWFLVED